MFLVCIGLIVALIVIFLIGRRFVTLDKVIMPKKDCGTCDGNNERCMHDCILEASVKDIEYYDDEELDRYRGRQSSSYSDDEAEEFREVMITMREEEVAGWQRSLTLRGVSVPDQIKDEMMIIIGGM